MVGQYEGLYQKEGTVGGRTCTTELRPANIESLKPEHLFMLCAWNGGEGSREARSPTEGWSGGPASEI